MTESGTRRSAVDHHEFRRAATGTDIVRGPNFDQLPPWPFDCPDDRMGWAQRQIDQVLER